VVEAPAPVVAAVAATAKTDMACLFRADLGRLDGPDVKATRMSGSRHWTRTPRQSGAAPTITFAESPQIGFWNTHSGGARPTLTALWRGEFP
jgi:hypothetical protein